jgi:hypothetical protein
MVEALWQRLNRGQRLVIAGSFPVLSQLVLMGGSPFGYEAPRPGRQFACDDRKALDVNGSLCLTAPSVEVRPAPVVNLIVVHPDRDSVEAADSRHRAMLGRSGSRNKTQENQD